MSLVIRIFRFLCFLWTKMHSLVPRLHVKIQITNYKTWTGMIYRMRAILVKYWPRGYKTFFMLNSSTKFQLLIKTKLPNFKKVLAFSLSDVVFIMLINFKMPAIVNVKMPTIVGILKFMSRINFVLNWVEYEKSFITPGPDLSCKWSAFSYSDTHLTQLWLTDRWITNTIVECWLAWNTLGDNLVSLRSNIFFAAVLWWLAFLTDTPHQYILSC